MPKPAMSRKASGNIAPCRFVKLDTSNRMQVAQAGTGDAVFGVSQPGTRRTPYGGLDDGFAAIAGENLLIFGWGEECLLDLGGTVSIGDRLKSDTNGKGVTSSSDGDYIGAIALVPGVSGDQIRVQTLTPDQSRGV